MLTTEILIVDDELNLAEALLFVLETEGYRARHVAHGKAVLEALLKTPAHLVISDCMMPGMTGAELLQAIRYREDLAPTPVLVVSSLPEEVVKAHCPTAQAVLRKPFRVADLMERVRELL